MDALRKHTHPRVGQDTDLPHAEPKALQPKSSIPL